MKRLIWRRASHGQRNLTLLFGLGLIGSEIHKAMGRYAECESHHHDFDWRDSHIRERQRDALVATYTGEDGLYERVDTIWAGGSSGFGSTDADMEAEYALLDEVIAVSEELRRQHPTARHSFHHLSSAGGLFEGQTGCTQSSLPAPQRPYGWGKLAQEKRISRINSGMVTHIYRPSTVYGYVRDGRSGLITALITNGLRGRSSHIFGGINTQRDYICADDIGTFVARQVIDPRPRTNGIHLLVDGKATSVHEVIKLVERTLHRKLLLQFDPRPTNSRNIAFLKSARPSTWSPMPLNVGIRHVLQKLGQG